MLFGLKTHAWFDLWSIEHFLSGMAVAIFAQCLLEKTAPAVMSAPTVSTRDRTVLILFVSAFLAFAWEALEFYLEAGYSGVDKITYWFQGVEFWGNRLITDPLITVTGALCGVRYPRYVIAARVFSAAWLAVHVFVFPHSMYLQEHILSI